MTQNFNGGSVIRAVVAPLQKGYDVLTRYEILHSRTVHRPSRIVDVGMVLAGVVVVFLTLLSPLAGICIGPIFLLWIYGILARWRLNWAVASQIAHAISTRRHTGDWDLIRLIPMSKARWLNTQLVATGFHTWPLVKGLVLTQAIISTTYYLLLLIETSSAYRGCYFEPCPQRISGLSFFLLGLPLMLAWIAFPIMEASLAAAVSSFVSSAIKRPAFSIAVSMLGVVFIRVILVLVGWGAVYFLYNEVAIGAGWIDPPAYSWEDPPYDSFPNLYEFLALMIFWEWLPAVGLAQFSSTYSAATYLVVFGAIFTAYVAAPMGIIHLLFKWTAQRLDSE